MITVNGYYIPLYNVRELYFGDSTRNLYIDRTNNGDFEPDVEEYKLSYSEYQLVKSMLAEKVYTDL